MVISVHRKPNDMQCYQIHYNFVTNIWIKYVRIRKSGYGIGWLLHSHIHVHLFGYTLFEMAFMLQYQYVCVHNFNFADRTSFFFSTISCVFFLSILKISNVTVQCWSYSTNLCFFHLQPKKNLFHKIYCVPRIICFFLISPLLFLCSFSTTKKRQISGVFMRCASKANALHCEKCVKEIQNIRCSVSVRNRECVCLCWSRRVESCHIDGR